MPENSKKSIIDFIFFSAFSALCLALVIQVSLFVEMVYHNKRVRDKASERVQLLAYQLHRENKLKHPEKYNSLDFLGSDTIPLPARIRTDQDFWNGNYLIKSYWGKI